MTFSDVITLLMTFFILLLTFSTTEPDRFERIQRNIFAGGNGAGVIGKPMDGPENESFISRVRPRAARMAMVGAEIPPYEKSSKSIGNGIKGISDEEAQQDTMSTNQFTIAIDKIYDANKKLTPKAAELGAIDRIVDGDLFRLESTLRDLVAWRGGCLCCTARVVWTAAARLRMGCLSFDVSCRNVCHSYGRPEIV